MIALVSRNAHHIKIILFLDLKTMTNHNITSSAHREQTLNPSTIHNMTAKTGSEKDNKSTSHNIGSVISLSSSLFSIASCVNI